MEDRNRITRLHTLLVVCLVLFAVLLGRMVYLQLWRGDYYAKQSDGNRLRQSRILAPRGIIYDSEGKELVNNLPGYAVVLQKQSSYKPETLQRLSNLLQMPVEEINAKIKASENFYEPIMLKNNLDQQMVTKIEEQRRYMPEVMLSVQPIRNYPYHELAVHALGYVGEVSSYEIEQGLFKNITQGSLVGKAGLEKTYDKYLRGEDGAFMEEVDVAGNVVKHYDSVQPIPGKNLKLTIDYELQKELEAFTDKHLAFLRSSGIAPGARAAAVVAIDPRNGAVRAMVSRPGYDPNWFVHGISSKNWNSINNDPNYPMNNKVITGEYPPGSTFKIVTGSAAFELKKVGLNEPIFDGGFHPMVPTMGNAGGEVLGWLTFIKALAMSDNVYFYELGYRVGIDNIEKYAHIFGFGERTGIDLEGESKGLVASKKVKREIWDEDWRLGDTFNAAIGQGFNLTTPIQLSVMLSIVANGGTKYQPYLVDSIINSDGSLFEKPKRAEGKHIDVSQQTIDYIRMGMSATTQEGGTASYFAGLPKPIAGKTGTAQIASGGVYRQAGHQVAFCGYFPADEPKYSCIVVIRQPRNGYPSGGTMSGGVVKAIAEKVYASHMSFDIRDMEKDSLAVTLPQPKAGERGALEYGLR